MTALARGDSGLADGRRQRIKLLLGAMVENREKVLVLIAEAKESDDHLALGFRSWGHYVSTEFAGLLAELTRDDRRFASFALAKTGMSSRAIASVVGADQSTVVRDIGQVMHRASPGLASKVDTLDGKTYTRPEPRPRPQPRRRPLPAAWVDALYQTERDVDRLTRLAADDRFPTHRAELARCGDLTRISKKLWKARQALAGDAALPLGGDTSVGRRKHLQMVEALVTTLSGAVIAFDNVTALDASVTKEEATRLTGDLSMQIRGLNRINNLLKAKVAVSDGVE